MKRGITIFIVLTAMAVVLPNAAQAHDRPYTGTPTRDGDVQANLSLLNLWGEQSEHIQALYEVAHNVLAENAEARFVDVARDERFQEICAEHDIHHLGGPMLGHVRPDGAHVWLRTTRPATVEVRVAVGREERVFGPVGSTEQTDLTAIVPISGLLPITHYPYRVWVNGVRIPMPEDAALLTAPHDVPTGVTRIAFGSCFHRWGLGNNAQSARIRSRRPSAMLLLGDIAVQDRNNHFGLHRADYLLRELMPAWQRLAASVPMYVTWDDHDYFDNDLAGIPNGFSAADRMGVRQVWRENWVNPHYGLEEAGGVFLRARVGPADILMVDNRYFREQGNFLGDAQMNWLIEALRECQGPFIILSCGTMWSDFVSDGKDSWGRYDPEGRERLFSLIETHQIGGVVFISGDRHGARGFRIPRPSGFSFYEFGAASLGGRRGPPVTKPEWETQLYGIEDAYAFGEFEMDTRLSEPTLTFRLIEAHGETLYEKTLTRRELTPGN